MTLQQLRYAVTIAENNSISEAAKQLFISQPTLSNAIKELEQEVGVSIFTRTNKGIHVSVNGAEFLGYARQVLQQADLLEEKYMNHAPRKQRFAVSTQHYSFAVNAFVDLTRDCGMDEYDFTLRETRTEEIIEDVRYLRSELGILHLNAFNEKVIQKMLRDNELVFTPIFTAKPHVFISRKNPLAKRNTITMEELEPYPCLSFEQGENSFYFAEELMSTVSHKRSIHVSDRATLFNLVIGLDGYTISSGILDAELNGEEIIAVPLRIQESMQIGTIAHKNFTMSPLAEKYLSFICTYLP